MKYLWPTLIALYLILCAVSAPVAAPIFIWLLWPELSARWRHLRHE